MKFKEPINGDTRWKRRFAFKPVSVYIGDVKYILWLEFYWEYYKYYECEWSEGGVWHSERRQKKHPSVIELSEGVK